MPLSRRWFLRSPVQLLPFAIATEAPVRAGPGMRGAGPRASLQATAQAPFVVSEPVQVAGPSPFPDGCEGSLLRSRVYRDSVVEPMLITDPQDPRHVVATWMQDRIATSSASGVLGAVSRDGGQTWTASTPTFTRCAGGTPENGGDYPRATDPWLTIAANGDIYSMVLAVNPFVGLETVSAILASKSTDGGDTWSDPVALIRDPATNGFNDKGTITADPDDANVVYAVWSRESPDAGKPGPGDAPAYFTRTIDGGQSWEAPRAIYAEPGVRTVGHVLVVLPNGDLVDHFSRSRPSDNGEMMHDIALIRSTDLGLTWSEPSSATDIVVAPLRDPYSTFPIQPDASLATLPSVAVDRGSGRLHIAWQDGRFSERSHIDIAYATSEDNGHTWSAPIRINQTTGEVPAFVPTVAVLDDGTVGVTYYDLRSAIPAEPSILTDYWLVTCSPESSKQGGEATWRETHIAGPFDLQRAPYGRGFFVGDYLGLTAVAGEFQTLYVVTEPPDAPSITSAEFVTVRIS